MPKISKERLRSVLDYKPETGMFFWKIVPNRNKRVGIGSTAGAKASTGYQQIKIDGVKYLSHRLAWLYIHGEWPPNQIDHINCNRADNRIANLRLATQSQNNANSRRSKSNTSGFKGVTYTIDMKKWRADIYIDKQYLCLGYFDKAETAHAAYMEAAKKFFGEFARAA